MPNFNYPMNDDGTTCDFQSPAIDRVVAGNRFASKMSFSKDRNHVRGKNLIVNGSIACNVF